MRKLVVIWLFAIISGQVYGQETMWFNVVSHPEYQSLEDVIMAGIRFIIMPEENWIEVQTIESAKWRTYVDVVVIPNGESGNTFITSMFVTFKNNQFPEVPGLLLDRKWRTDSASTAADVHTTALSLGGWAIDEAIKTIRPFQELEQ